MVPAIFRTDGTRVWSDRIAHCLDRYGYAPHPGLRRHFATRQEPPPQVTARVCGQRGRLVFAEPAPASCRPARTEISIMRRGKPGRHPEVPLDPAPAGRRAADNVTSPRRSHPAIRVIRVVISGCAPPE
ncbi:hypothetical protein GCM10023335_14650 [Streptomyces siamensis]|uniref:Winged helix-turn helix domain-containing protein n=1 Tax=Streptomyces siamensis TaxID=1274986 RepID=A0ABP9IMQ8_9ACTN